MRAKAYKLVTRINYRRNTTGKAGCICSERRENVVCFVFRLLSLMICISEDLRLLSVCFKAFSCQQNKDVVLKTTCCNIRIDMRGKV